MVLAVGLRAAAEASGLFDTGQRSSAMSAYSGVEYWRGVTDACVRWSQAAKRLTTSVS